jgi:SAM-dependent methyltransferase
MSSQSFDPQFDSFADDYDAALARGISVSGEDKNFFARGRLQHLARVLQRVSFKPQSIMDFGCGTGSATPFLFELFPGARLVGTDISARSLDVAQRMHGGPQASFALMDNHKPDGSLDLVFCNGVLHHIPPAARPRCLQFILDSLRPGGVFAMFENNPWNPGTRLVMSRIPFDKDAITLSPPDSRRIFRAAGFEVLRSDFLFYFPRVLKWLRPLESALLKLPLGAQYLILGQKTIL